MFSHFWSMRNAFSALVTNQRLTNLALTFIRQRTAFVMDCAMIFRRDKHQIFGAVVVSIPVDMMDYLARIKRSTKHLFHNVSMDANLSAVYPHLLVLGVHLFGRFCLSLLWHIASIKGHGPTVLLHLSRVRQFLRRAVMETINGAYPRQKVLYH